MYARQQSRGNNTKYTDFIRNYFPETHSVINSKNIIKNNTLENNSHAHSDPSLLISSSENKTKFTQLFSTYDREKSTNRSFTKDPKFAKLENQTKLPKIQSDPNLAQLHTKIVNNFNDIPPQVQYKFNNQTSEGPGASSESSNPTELLSELEKNLQKLNEETIHLLNRAKSSSIAQLEDVMTQGSEQNVNYQNVLKAEHIALRREMLNSIREISRATFFEDLYGKNSDKPPVDEHGRSFHLNQETADPAERVDEWIRSSQEHLNNPRIRSNSASNNLAEKPALHASLFHDSSAWHDNDENEDEDVLQHEDFTDDTSQHPPAPAPKLVVTKKPVNLNNFAGKSLLAAAANRTENAHRRHKEMLSNFSLLPPSPLNMRAEVTNFKNRAPYTRLQISESLTCETERMEENAQRRRPIRRKSLSLILQPKTEKFPPAIFEPRKRYKNTKLIPAKLPPLLVARSKSFDRDNIKIHNPSHQVESQTVGYVKNRKAATKTNRAAAVPGILRRSNMDQWVAKKVWFYVNGDEHRPKFEYRFRPKRDVKDLDTLCDILTNRLNVPRGIRYVFTMDGVPVEKMDDLEHERHYVLSSTKKFKVTPYKDYFAPVKPADTFLARKANKTLRQSV